MQLQDFNAWPYNVRQICKHNCQGLWTQCVRIRAKRAEMLQQNWWIFNTGAETSHYKRLASRLRRYASDLSKKLFASHANLSSFKYLKQCNIWLNAVYLHSHCRFIKEFLSFSNTLQSDLCARHFSFASPVAHQKLMQEQNHIGKQD